MLIIYDSKFIMDQNEQINIATKALISLDHDVTLTVEKAIHRLIDSIPQFTHDIDGIDFHDLSHIFANATGGIYDEEDPAFIIQNALKGVLLQNGIDDTPEYVEIRKLLQQRAAVTLAFSQALTGIEKPFENPVSELADIPLCMFGIVPDKNPIRVFSGKHPYRLMSLDERKEVLGKFTELMSQTVIYGRALEKAPQRIDILAQG